MKQFFFMWASLALGLALILLLRGSARAQAPGVPQPASQPVPPSGLRISGTVRSITLPENEPELPPGPGRATAQLFCGMCHTTRYITIQPPLSRETWLTEVTKMRKAFSAPIPEEKVPEIIGYLIAINSPTTQSAK